MEEAGYIDWRVVMEVVMPTLLLETAGLICISTLLDTTNWYSKLISQIKPNGQPLVRSYQVQLVCKRPECEANPSECWHNIHQVPGWHSTSRHSMLRDVLEDHPELVNRELMFVYFYFPIDNKTTEELHRIQRRECLFRKV